MKRYIFLLTLIFASIPFAYSQGNTCTREDQCFRYEYLGATENNDNTYTLTYTLQVNCTTPLEYVAFELPEGKRASGPASVYAKDPKYLVYNGKTSGNKVQTDFNAIQFTAKNNVVIANGMMDTLRYNLDAADFANLQEVQVQAKAGNTTSLVTFDLMECGVETTLPTPVCTLDAGTVIFGFVDAVANADGTTTVRITIQNNMAADVQSVSIEGADPTQPLLVPVSGASYKGKYKYQVTTDDGIITFTAQNTTGYANMQQDMFVFTIPTEAYEVEPFYTITVATSEGIVTTGFNTETCEDDAITPLPVELISFDGKATKSGIELSWSTASETDNDRFEVERSTDAKTFTTIGTVKGAGTTSLVQRYTYKVNTTESGTHYFRIRQVDFDGTSETSKVIAVETRSNLAAGMAVYPNPAAGQNISITLPAQPMDSGAQLRISDMNGRVLLTQLVDAGQSHISLSLPALQITKGIYMVSLHTQDRVETQKLFVQ